MSAHLVINAVFNEAVRNKKLAESPCTGIPVPDVVHAADFALPTDAQLEALAAGLPEDWAATVWLMYGCGLRIRLGGDRQAHRQPRHHRGRVPVPGAGGTST